MPDDDDTSSSQHRQSTAGPPAWRRLPIGAEPAPEGGVHFRVWAPDRRRVDVVLQSDHARHGAATARSRAPGREGGGRAFALERERNGYFSGAIADARVGTLYRFRLDGGDSLPDPASRYQPDGPHGPSCVIDARAFAWSDMKWQGIAIEGQVIYELHVGTFTREGSWAGAMRALPALADIGITVLEIMPVAEFAGEFGWGYDGVGLYAPTRLYGTPDDFRRFVDRAHALGLGVILDVVYNHLGPDGNYLAEYASSYFRKDEPTEWGDAINFDGEACAPVREFFSGNAAYWIDEFHLDGLRLDATQSIRDGSATHIVQELTQRARASAAGRRIVVVAENEPQDAMQVRSPEEGGLGLDAVWNDDFHHSATVAATGRDEAYYTDYRGGAQEFVSMAKYGFLYQGQCYKWQQARRGSPTFGIAPAHFVVFLQNHDQVANSALGKRLHELTSPGRYRALTALLLLGPQTPMLFQGQEFAASAPFLFFADHHPELAELVRKGRFEFLAQFPSIEAAEMSERLAVPHDARTFRQCVLDPSERERNAHVVALHRDLLRLRRTEPCFGQQRLGGVDGAVLGDSCFVLRFFGVQGDDRLLCVNLGRTVHMDPAPEPLLAPPAASRWHLLWSSEAPGYGGMGTPPVDAAEAERRIPQGNASCMRPFENWRIPGECAVVLAPQPSASRHH